MKSYVQSKITRREIASAAAISRNSQAQGKPGRQKSTSNTSKNKQRQQLSEEEKKRRTRFKGKCFRCGSADYMQPNCPRSAGITCNICKQLGHMSSVCLQAAAARIVQDQQPSYTVSYPPCVQQPQQLTRQQPMAVDYSDSVSAYTAQLHNMPTPQDPL